MAYDIHRDYTAASDGAGGVVLRPRPALAAALRRFRFRDHTGTLDSFLPGRPGQTPETPEERRATLSMQLADAHRLSFPNGDPKLRRQNDANRRHYSRDQQEPGELSSSAEEFQQFEENGNGNGTTTRQTLFKHTPVPGERLEVVKNPDDSVSVVLVGPAADEMTGLDPRDGYHRAGGLAPARRGADARLPRNTADALRRQNEVNKEFYRRKG